jgi:hypothetical protein
MSSFDPVAIAANPSSLAAFAPSPPPSATIFSTSSRVFSTILLAFS